jgi:hypothetical protein
MPKVVSRRCHGFLLEAVPAGALPTLSGKAAELGASGITGPTLASRPRRRATRHRIQGAVLSLADLVPRGRRCPVRTPGARCEEEI